MKKFGLQVRYPQNYIIKRPVIGAIILFLFSFGFTLLYHPLDAHESFYFGFELSMLVYAFISSIIAGIVIHFIKMLPFFSKLEKWTLGKEISAILIVLLAIGLTIFLIAFIIEPPTSGSRWNWATFLNSCMYAFLIFIIPFAFFSTVHYKFLFLNFESTLKDFQNEKQQLLTVHIRSKLKKESLSFKSDELLFATAEGNYVIFNLFQEEEVKKIPIRNSISNIEHQLKHIPIFFRCHRGFIVNLNMVVSKKGNASGYLLKIKYSDDIIPLSRKYTTIFDELMEYSR
jgi:hypothetical protein